jgi:hypothetical protein
LQRQEEELQRLRLLTHDRGDKPCK